MIFIILYYYIILTSLVMVSIKAGRPDLDSGQGQEYFSRPVCLELL
jgi:hypothetical protein